ncbi:hypothetical protein C882_0029 [Caenispirillum salinarum AK4]|uniref:Cytochrome c domain-containing protein n=1 Tax=Caenispirillum salinarum AK4 TaxID=1238182 RepID=K9HXL8_9PROT|nr:c-type cytochrome [Caenispirillum salinarum]EKV32946.1 hypothetical protein C882_0029 [Caenispirillum salinarum AK4]
MITHILKSALPAAILGAMLALPAGASEHGGEGDGMKAAGTDIIGAYTYRQHCASCHGMKGAGDGPVAKFLNVDVPDLTTLAERNDGRFPFLKVFHIIDGRQTLRAHGNAMMPVWGSVFRYEAGGDEQPINRMATETTVRGRVLELVNYIAAIQDPAGETGGPILEAPAD